MKIEIDTNKDSEEEIRHIVKMLMNLLGDNIALQTEIAREEMIKKSKSSYGSDSQSEEPTPEVSDDGNCSDFSFFDENKDEDKQSENRVVNEPKEKAKAKAKVEEEEEFDFSKLMEY